MKTVDRFIQSLERHQRTPMWYSRDYHAVFEREADGWSWSLEDSCFDNLETRWIYEGMVDDDTIDVTGFVTRAAAAESARDYLQTMFAIDIDISGFRVLARTQYTVDEHGYEVTFQRYPRYRVWTVLRYPQSPLPTSISEQLAPDTGAFKPEYAVALGFQTLREAVECYLNAG